MAVVARPESGHEAQKGVLEPGNQEEISALAYALWIQRGCPLGSPEVDWFRAEEELKKTEGTLGGGVRAASGGLVLKRNPTNVRI
jgi:hypothetical protein